MSGVPDVRRCVASCMACHHWQIDVRPGAVSGLGGAQPALIAMGQAHADHLNECPGEGGRVRFQGRWVDPPRMSSGKTADGTLQLEPLPRWWVSS